MLTINVAPDGSGQFTTISEAVLAVPYDCPAVIRIAPGIYREKLVCEKKDITLAGAGMDATRLVWNDGGKLPHPDGRPTHTFRSYTAFFSGEKLRVEDMTIENDAGPGAKVGVAVSGGVDSWVLLEVLRRRQRIVPFRFDIMAIHLNPGFDAENHAPLVEYLASPSPTTVCLIIADSLAKNTRLYKAIAKIDKKAVIDCSGTKRWELPRRVQQMATQHGKSISAAAAEELVSRSGENTRMLDNDLAKLARMVEAPQIELADVERWIVRTAEVQPWDFLNAVSARDLRRSLELFKLLPSKSYVWTYTLVCGRIRELIVAKALDARGQGRELAATLKLQSWQVKNHLTWARRFSMTELVAALEGAVDVELALKGSADSEIALLLWITNILRKS